LTEEQVAPVPLTAHDRCDQCGARAVFSAFRPHALSTPELLLCGHHAESNREALTAKGWTIAS
jgi:hypothetical protein